MRLCSIYLNPYQKFFEFSILLSIYLSNQAAVVNERNCSCPRNSRDNCPLDGQCLANAIVYKADVITDNNTKVYTGATKSEFKKRLAVHKNSFRNRTQCQTCLSSYIWDLKDQNVDYEIMWTLHHQAFPYQCGTRKCDLCLTEKLVILRSDLRWSLNKRSEIMNKCRHRKDCKLSSVS